MSSVTGGCAAGAATGRGESLYGVRVVAAQRCGPTLAEGLPLSQGQPQRTAALPAFTLLEGRPSSVRFSGSCQSKMGRAEPR